MTNTSPISRVIVTTVPFGAHDPRPLDLIQRAGIECAINPLGRKLRANEVAEVIRGFPVVIAGTEPITAQVMQAVPELRAICRVGIGLDSVDLSAARQRGIHVAYTPDGPSPAVAELTIGLIIDLLRGISPVDRNLRSGAWRRFAGWRVATATIGIIGVGRIGSRVIGHLRNGFPGVRILANDIEPNRALSETGVVEWTDKETIYRECDVISLHVPLTAETRNLVSAREIDLMKPTAALVNTARGGIVNEPDLAAALRAGRLRAAAIDVFAEEPYRGELVDIESAILTCHMGSMTADCRLRMEVEAAEEAVRFAKGEPFKSPVPEAEYRLHERLAEASVP